MNLQYTSGPAHFRRRLPYWRRLLSSILFTVGAGWLSFTSLLWLEARWSAVAALIVALLLPPPRSRVLYLRGFADRKANTDLRRAFERRLSRYVKVTSIYHFESNPLTPLVAGLLCCAVAMAIAISLTLILVLMGPLSLVLAALLCGWLVERSQVKRGARPLLRVLGFTIATAVASIGLLLLSALGGVLYFFVLALPTGVAVFRILLKAYLALTVDRINTLDELALYFDRNARRGRRLKRLLPHFLISRLLDPPHKLAVADAVWQEAVVRLISTSTIVVVDVSSPGEGLLWEIETVLRRPDLKTICISSVDFSTGSARRRGLPVDPEIMARFEAVIGEIPVLVKRSSVFGGARFQMELVSAIVDRAS